MTDWGLVLPREPTEPTYGLPRLWFSIDPGDRNVGVSTWSGTECLLAEHTDPDNLVDGLVGLVTAKAVGLVVYEAFNLRGEFAMQQQGSEFLTSQLIGAIRHVCRRGGVPTDSHRPSDHKGLYKNARFKPPLRPHRAWRSYGNGGHAKDSECLGLYHVRKTVREQTGKEWFPDW